MASSLPPFPPFNVEDDATGQRWTKWGKNKKQLAVQENHYHNYVLLLYRYIYFILDHWFN